MTIATGGSRPAMRDDAVLALVGVIACVRQ